jgi:ABC-type lipoprotein export system ATPase subunit
VVLADEPTAELDAENRSRVLEAFRQAAGRGAAVLLTTHDDEVAARCDRVLHLQDGRLRAAT